MTDASPVRRAPPPFRTATVEHTAPMTPHLRRVTLAGPALVGFPEPAAAASVRLLLPEPEGLVVPEWNGNEFLLPGGRRPVLRTFTPVVVDPVAGRLVVDVVLHHGGAASAWADATGPGDTVAVSGPGRGWTPPRGFRSFVVAGDESAVPAIRQVLATLPDGAHATVHVEVAHPDARSDLGGTPLATVVWHDRPPGAPPGAPLVAALTTGAPDPAAAHWIAGEAAAVQRIRLHLFHDHGLPRSDHTVRGYWKRGASGGNDD